MSYSPEATSLALPSAETDVMAEFATEFGEQIQTVLPRFVRGQQEDGLLKLSLVRKVSPTGAYLAKRGWIPTTPNSFGLPPGETCPGKTDFCEDCYAFGSMRSKGVKDMLDANYALLRSLESQAEMEQYLCEMVQRYEAAAQHNGVLPEDRVFRIHWSGDFYSEDYARAWAATIKQFPDISFWAYTRSFRPPVDVVPILDGIENLALLISADVGNIAELPDEYSHLPRANSTVDVVHAREFERSELKTVTCPENLDRLKLMQDGEGACIKCRLCFDKKKGLPDITFVTSGKYDATPRSRFAHDVPEKPVQLTGGAVRPVSRARYITNEALEQ